MSPARSFAVASLLFGALLIALTPPFQTPDEPAHLFRAWSIAEGTFVARGGAAVPRSLVEAAASSLRRPTFARTPLRPDDRRFVPTVSDPLGYSAPIYTPLGYVATSTAILIGRALDASPVLLVYLGRAANLLLSTLVIAIAIRRAQFGRWALALLALTPMCVFMRMSLSVDALTIACAFALVVEIVRGEAATSVALSFAIAAIKPGYALLPLLAFGVPRLRARRAVLAMIIAAVLAGTAVAGFWTREASTPPPAAVDPHGRLSAMLHAPLAFAARMTRELAGVSGLLAIETVADFGWLDAPAPLAFALIWLAALAALAVVDGPAGGVSRVWSLLLFAGTVVTITTVFHLYAPAPQFLKGMQGRYFLPVLPLALLPLCSVRAAEQVKRRVVIAMTALGAAQSAWILVARFWS